MPDTHQNQTHEIVDVQIWQAHALRALLGVLVVAATPVVILTVMEAIRHPERSAAAPLFGAFYVLLLLLTFLRRVPHRVRLIGFLTVGYAVAVTTLMRGGLVGDGRLYLMILPLLTLALSDLRLGLVVGLFSFLIHLAFMLFAQIGWLSQWVVVKENPMGIGDWLVSTAVFLMLLAGLLAVVGLSNRSFTRALQSAQQSARERAVAYNMLESQTRELERRARWLEVATLVGREAGALVEPGVLFSRVAEEMARRLDLEEVVFYTVSPRGEMVAQAMVESHRMTPKGVLPPEQSLTVQEAFRSNSVLAGWVGGLYEVALPMRLPERVVGMMVVRFPTEVRPDGPEVAVLGLIADQFAMALENHRLFSETQASLRELEALYRRYTTQAWERFVRESPESVRLWTGPEEVPEGVWQRLFEQARTSGSAAIGEEDSRYLLAVPVKLRGIAVGVLGFHREQEAGQWRPEEVAMAEAIAERLALAVENARLLEDAQRRAVREQRVAEISTQLRASLDPDIILKTTARELGRALRARWVAVEVTGSSQNGAVRSQEVDG